jgi:hypothetical protein
MGIALAMLASFPAFAQITEYDTAVTAQTSLTITNAQHGFNCSDLAVSVLDSNGVLQPESFTTGTIDSTTYEVNMSWSSAFTGTVKLYGCYGADTSASIDFKGALFNHTDCSGLACTSVPDGLVVCNSCTKGAPAMRTVGGFQFVDDGLDSFRLTLNCTGNYWVWADGDVQKVILGVSNSGGGITCAHVGSGVQLEVDYNVTGFPSSGDILKIAHGAFDVYPYGFTSITDDRPF